MKLFVSFRYSEESIRIRVSDIEANNGRIPCECSVLAQTASLISISCFS